MSFCFECKWLLVVAFIYIGFSSFASANAHRHYQIHQDQQQQQRHFNKRQQKSTESVSETESESSSWIGPEFMIIRRVYDDCQDKNDFIGCLKQKALNALSRALDQDSIKIVDGLVLEKTNKTEQSSIITSVIDARSLNNLSPLDKALLSKADILARTHALKIDISSTARGHDEKKKKKDKGGGHVKYVIAALLIAMGIAGPIGLKALAAIAGMALVISKVALTIAGIIALKKLFSHDHHEETSFQVHAGDHNRRSTYVVRPVTKSSAVPAVATSASMDPYRYYYEYQ